MDESERAVKFMMKLRTLSIESNAKRTLERQYSLKRAGHTSRPLQIHRVYPSKVVGLGTGEHRLFSATASRAQPHPQHSVLDGKPLLDIDDEDVQWNHNRSICSVEGRGSNLILSSHHIIIIRTTLLFLPTPSQNQTVANTTAIAAFTYMER